MKKYKKKIIMGAAVAVILAVVFWWGGDAPTLRGWNTESTAKVDSAQNVNHVGEVEQEEGNITQNTKDETDVSEEGEPSKLDKPEAADGGHMTAEEKVALAEHMAQNQSSEVHAAEGYEENNTQNIDYSKVNGMKIDENTGEDIYKTEPVPEGQPVPVEPNETEISDRELTCTMSVRCDTIFNNISWLDTEKRELLPEDGVIFPEQSVKFYDGESVFNLLVREMKRNKIHMEFESTPVYNSAYIEGIGNIYEFDCGELSGWMYRVNGWFPNYGCSRYQLKNGDRVEWVYTCDLGVDVGGEYSARNGR